MIEKMSAICALGNLDIKSEHKPGCINAQKMSWIDSAGDVVR